MSHYTHFDTERLQVRPLTEQDAPGILALNLDPDWKKYIGDRGVFDLASARGYIKNGPARMYREFGFGVLAVREAETGEFLGTCGLLKRDNLASPDIGFAFLPIARGKGYAFEACAGLLHSVRQQAQWPHIEALVTPENAASIALLKKLGFQYLKNLPDFDPNKDTDLYRLTL
ncbi:GNAT family N-acetyltransferase [Planctobacterium marinum]|uniref:GNAT family N-acetyltransferase n=1 Tax=Planctobacterium marinum TaxID=1631968 RepID=UPI001E3288CB|nr:GNAT family N-acetyltransferase [Planctobacterium marinum]MCC2607782.1 GNAT family N-acetyltransferase [Planctobacterium marinum]